MSGIKANWTDATSYSQGQRGKTEPTSWECAISGHRIWISKGHLHYPGEWIVRLPPRGEQIKVIANGDVPAEHAQRLALDCVAAHAQAEASKWQNLINAIDEIMESST